jgi:biopolymer transport protein ExbB/TolQ
MSIGFVFIILVGLLVTVVMWGLIIWGIVWLVRYLKRSREESQRFRLELGKLAEEVHLIRQKLEGGKKQESLTESE